MSLPNGNEDQLNDFLGAAILGVVAGICLAIGLGILRI